MIPKGPVKPDPQPVTGLACPYCQAQQVAPLPPDGISRNPGYRCLSCDALMRGMTGMYIVAIIIGIGLTVLALGLFKPFGAEGDASFRGLVSPIFIPIFLTSVIWALFYLRRPRPVRIKKSAP